MLTRRDLDYSSASALWDHHTSPPDKMNRESASGITRDCIGTNRSVMPAMCMHGDSDFRREVESLGEGREESTGRVVEGAAAAKQVTLRQGEVVDGEFRHVEDEELQPNKAVEMILETTQPLEGVADMQAVVEVEGERMVNDDLEQGVKVDIIVDTNDIEKDGVEAQRTAEVGRMEVEVEMVGGKAVEKCVDQRIVEEERAEDEHPMQEVLEREGVVEEEVDEMDEGGQGDVEPNSAVEQLLGRGDAMREGSEEGDVVDGVGEGRVGATEVFAAPATCGDDSTERQSRAELLGSSVEFVTEGATQMEASTHTGFAETAGAPQLGGATNLSQTKRADHPASGLELCLHTPTKRKHVGVCALSGAEDNQAPAAASPVGVQAPNVQGERMGPNSSPLPADALIKQQDIGVGQIQCVGHCQDGLTFAPAGSSRGEEHPLQRLGAVQSVDYRESCTETETDRDHPSAPFDPGFFDNCDQIRRNSEESSTEGLRAMHLLPQATASGMPLALHGADAAVPQQSALYSPAQGLHLQTSSGLQVTQSESIEISMWAKGNELEFDQPNPIASNSDATFAHERFQEPSGESNANTVRGDRSPLEEVVQMQDSQTISVVSETQIGSHHHQHDDFVQPWSRHPERDHSQQDSEATPLDHANRPLAAPFVSLDCEESLASSKRALLDVNLPSSARFSTSPPDFSIQQKLSPSKEFPAKRLRQEKLLTAQKQQKPQKQALSDAAAGDSGVPPRAKEHEFNAYDDIVKGRTSGLAIATAGEKQANNPEKANVQGKAPHVGVSSASKRAKKKLRGTPHAFEWGQLRARGASYQSYLE
ncbi:MAG: hypothetical protein SGPRY_004801 [Prymnesium sp.]